MNVLVVHGPNLNLLGESRKDPISYGELNRRLEAFAGELGATLKIVQSNHEGVLLDTLQAERHWADAILINPAALTHTSYVLRECLRMINRPTIEVHLEDIRRRETWRRKSVIKDVCEAQVMGKGLVSYLDALERLVTGEYKGVKKSRSRVTTAVTGKSIGPAPAAKSGATRRTTRSTATATSTANRKTIGRKIPTADPAALLKDAARAAPASPQQVVKTIGRLPSPAESPSVVKSIGRAAENVERLVRPSSGITRAEVRERIAQRLGNQLSPGALASWAREQWLNVERGAPAEMGQRELLTEALQTLALSSTPTGQLSEGELIELMTRLG